MSNAVFFLHITFRIFKHTLETFDPRGLIQVSHSKDENT